MKWLAMIAIFAIFATQELVAQTTQSIGRQDSKRIEQQQNSHAKKPLSEKRLKKNEMTPTERAEIKLLVKKAKAGDLKAKEALMKKINDNFARRTREAQKKIKIQEEQLEKTKKRLEKIQKDQAKRSEEILNKMMGS